MRGSDKTATTKIWAVRCSFESAIDYAENPDKTVIKISDTGEEITDISQVIEYAMRKEKISEGSGEIEKKYITGINCSREHAVEEFAITKKAYGKTDRVLAWHGYQSFLPGEVTPDEAHEIGVKLAREMWGDRFEVVVTTHLDREHIHNHFVVNSVSFLDGGKYKGNRENYFLMRQISDRLCEEYGKSVVLNPKYNGITRGEYRARIEGRKTKADIVREDVDHYIKEAKSMADFKRLMGLAGYRIKDAGKYFTVIPPDGRAVRLDRRYEGYSPEEIVKRINESMPRIREPKRYRAVGVVKRPVHRMPRLKGIYYSYMYRLGMLPKPRYKKGHYLIREELINASKINNEMKFMIANRINTMHDLDMTEKMLAGSYEDLAEKRKSIRNRIRRAEGERREAYYGELALINSDIGKIRKQLYYCKDIRERSVRMSERTAAVRQLENERSGKHERSK